MLDSVLARSFIKVKIGQPSGQRRSRFNVAQMQVLAPNARAIVVAYGSAASDPVEKSVVNSTFFSLGRVGVIRSGAAIIHLL